MNIRKHVSLIALLVTPFVVGCGGSSTSDPATSADGEVVKTGDGKVVSKAW